MISYIVRRLLWVVVILWGVSLLTFLVAYAVPADPARLYAGPRASAEVVRSIRHQMGLDRPVYVQYLDYVGHVLRGDFGYSYHLQSSVLPVILGHFPATAQLAVAGIIVELLLGLPLGVLAALHRNSWIDRLALLLSLLSISAPTFVVGILLLYVLGYVVPIFPLGGYGGLTNLILPALALGFGGAGWYARTLRSTMLEVLGMDYVRTARAKGVGGLSIALRHVLRNALGPIVTNLGLDMAYFLGGVLVIETVFGWPGIGGLAYQAIGYQDIPMIMGTVLFGALIIVLMNLLIDLSYGFLDPRVRYE
jgi:ABC-type dipeptide/oligopeptide/nickel transport system permease component